MLRTGMKITYVERMRPHMVKMTPVIAETGDFPSGTLYGPTRTRA